MARDLLVVEDEEHLATLYARQLGDAYDVTIATSGREALDIVDERGAVFDAILLDRRMPEVSGDEVLAAIRDRDLDAPVAMVTAVRPEFDIVGMGFDDYLTKPVSKEELKATVDRLIAQSTYDDAVRDHLKLVSTQTALEADKSDDELEASEAYARLETQLAESRAALDATVSGDVFVELLLTQTGDWLYLVVQYDADGWTYRYLSDDIERTIATGDRAVDDVVEQLRRERSEYEALNDALDLEEYACSLHLFDEIVLLHLNRSDTAGILCGFDPQAAPELSDFLALVRPYLDASGIEAE